MSEVRPALHAERPPAVRRGENKRGHIVGSGKSQYTEGGRECPFPSSDRHTGKGQKEEASLKVATLAVSEKTRTLGQRLPKA